ncbi:hypothetical protein GCM10011331_07000 [Flavimobilis marinus]|uniref:Forkhead associated (FHA) domain, binds pSer, pThr, pTyr n=1 Tax=Flavimobilis marinus TaxID=285351 RepID=A0A1I2CXX2_9MICO|nr:FHA domain-containing protein [Flavimobilis marinus]GHG46761.1 hypothetical protein GCM10011331_07000 [Flavimobilis marinus]SFE72590.1 Forkhead associated (FHA) domain, binds pSer, pThr, pTyr [Flavimobilis marinus]
MIVPHYSPGAWFAVVTDGVIALLPPDTLPAVVELVWEAAREDAAFEDQLSLLTSGRSTGKAPFALVSLAGGDVRAAVRGDLEVVLEESIGAPPRRVVGDQIPWTSVAASATAVSVGVVGASSRGPALPVLSGVVTACEVIVTLREADDDVADVATRSGAEVVEFDEELDGVTILSPRRAAAAEVVEFDEELHGATILTPRRAAAPGARTPASPATGSTVPTAATPLAPPPLPTPPPAPPARPAPVQASAFMPALDDHDGLTVMSSDLVEIRRQLPTWSTNEVPGPFTMPTLVAPPKLVMSSGVTVTLDRTVLIGRAPVVSRVSNRDLPRLVTVESPNHDISRTHAQVRAEGDRVLLTDLDSTNGVTLSLRGRPAERIRPGVAVDVPPDATVDLGDGVMFRVVRS